ncbi:MAG: hypothetical protein CFE44_15765 [Burkholderiales bacterium PBB4]|nr:MAG: hypothetical protein CFE44_15765 [Burkholderiales bacterium PBB4]
MRVSVRNWERFQALFVASAPIPYGDTVLMIKPFAQLTLTGVLALALGACGGAGGSSDSTTPSTTTPTTTTPAVLTLSGTHTVTGVAANGAPLLGAQVRVIDATGVPVTLLDAAGTRVSSLRTSTADGSYRLTLSTTRTPLPLLIQAAGVDGSGMPVVVHTALISTTVPLIAHVTPISEALTGLLLGASPRAVFAQPALAASNLPLLRDATALTSASDLLKSVLATSMTDTKVTNTKTLDLLADPSFVANRATLDAVLDGLRIQVTKDAGGRDIVQISNKFLTPGTVEVSLDLATARTELLLGTTGVLTKAITSLLKVATSPHKASLVNLATIDGLSTRINAQITQGASSATMSSALLGVYTQQDGRSKTAMADLLAEYAANNLQLGRWSLLGCAEDPIPSKGCTKFQAGALVINSAGQAVGVLNETLGNDTSKPVRWTLLGNGRSGDARIQHVAQLRLNLDGTVPAGGPPATNGLQLVARAQDATATPTLSGATVQVPSGYGVRMVYCNVRDLCVSPGPSTVAATGELSDTLLQQTPGWVGSQDAALGALYVATLTPTGGTAFTFNTYLRSKLATDLSTSLFPKPDAPLTLASVNSDLLLNWRNWSDANPDMQVKSVRLIANSPAVIRDFNLGGPMVTSVFIPAPTTPITSFQIWLGAQDSLGRMFYSQLKSGL